ncbi:MAG: DNA repair protein RecN [Acidobacteria bacterium]|nr:DNA repair protein RecN [Acidobacteriota bacterium]
MIRYLGIQRLAVIDAIEVNFEPGLNILTGETGAGKSILVGAIGLLMGDRASADLIRTGETDAVIQAVFETSDGRESIVRREISSQGRSRAFIDGALVTTNALKDLAATLVEIHGQHDHQILLDPAAHLDLLDEFGKLAEQRAETTARFEALRRARTELDRVQMDDRERRARLELLDFQVREIERVNPGATEDEELATIRRVLANAERLQRLSVESYSALYEGDQAVLANLSGVWRRLSELATLDPSFALHLESRDAIKSQLEDLAYSLRQYSGALDASPERLQQVEDRLAAIERLKRKYGPTLADLRAHLADMKAEVQALQTSTEREGELQRIYDGARADFMTVARQLAESRRRAGRTLARGLESMLAELAMERARCEVRFSAELPDAGWSERGVDAAEFYLSPNPGEELRPLARIASGGELSRVMLALRALTAEGSRAKTLIFDEVDAGIGGHVADVVGQRLRDLGRRFQVLCITHLPQIAVYGSTHLAIAKAIRGRRTVTHVAKLDGTTRVDEIGRMIGGELSDQVRATAKEMLVQRGRTETHQGEGERAKAKGKRVG